MVFIYYTIIYIIKSLWNHDNESCFIYIPSIHSQSLQYLGVLYYNTTQII